MYLKLIYSYMSIISMKLEEKEKLHKSCSSPIESLYIISEMTWDTSVRQSELWTGSSLPWTTNALGWDTQEKDMEATTFERDIKHLNGVRDEVFSITKFLSILESAIHIDIEILNFSSVAQSCLTLWPHESQHSKPPCPSQTHRVYSNSCPSSRWCHPASHLILCHPLLLLAPIPPNIRVFSNESTLRMMWPKY